MFFQNPQPSYYSYNNQSQYRPAFNSLASEDDYYFAQDSVKPQNFEEMLSYSRNGTADTIPMNYQQEQQGWFPYMNSTNQLPVDQDSDSNYYTNEESNIPEANFDYNTFYQAPISYQAEVKQESEVVLPNKTTPVDLSGANSSWEEADDAKLMHLAKKFKNAWERIAKEFLPKKFTITFLKKQYAKVMSEQTAFPRRIKFSESEDLIIVKGYLENETNWDIISSKLVNRTAEMVKNRFYNHIKRKNLYDGLLARVQAGEAGELAQIHSIENKIEPVEEPKEEAKPNKFADGFIKSQETILNMMQISHESIKREGPMDKTELVNYVAMLERTLMENLGMMQTLKDKLRNATF